MEKIRCNIRYEKKTKTIACETMM